jgi:hypothetical protein
MNKQVKILCRHSANVPFTAGEWKALQEYMRKHGAKIAPLYHALVIRELKADGYQVGE